MILFLSAPDGEEVVGAGARRDAQDVAAAQDSATDIERPS
jgi:hypothetical protein